MTHEIQFTHNDYEITKREVLYQGVFRLARYHIRQRLFNGHWSDIYQREIFERFSAAAVLPYDPHLDRIILIEQFRAGSLAHPHSPWLIEIPAGIIENKETPEHVAQRESVEESGCEITALEPICDYFVSPGGSNEYLYLFCGKVDASHAEGIYGLEKEHEDIRVMNVTTDEALTKLRSGKIKNAPTIIALLWLQLNRERLQEIW